MNTNSPCGQNMRSLLVSGLTGLLVSLPSCGGETTRRDAWACGETESHAMCHCTRSADGLEPKFHAVNDCAPFKCCYLRDNGDCTCLSDVLGQPLSDCGLVQVIDGAPIEKCPPN